MKLLFVNAHYSPDVASTGEYLTDLSEFLASHGAEVQVVTSRTRYAGSAVDAPTDETRRGVHVHRLATSNRGRGSFIDRILDYLSFYVLATRHAVFGRERDLSVYLTTPPLIGVLGLLGWWTRRRPYVIWSMDLHPEAEIALGMLQPRTLLTKAIGMVDRWAYRSARCVVVLGRCMEERVLAKGVDPERIARIGLWKGTEEVKPLARGQNPLAEEVNLTDEFVVMYSGNAGLAHRFVEVKGALDSFRDQEGLQFLFVGAGPRREEIERHIAAENIPNARYLDYFPREATRYSLPLGDLHLITLRDDMAGIAVPSKLFGIMASGAPVIMIGPRRSEVSRIIEETGCGIVLDPGADGDLTTQFIAEVGRLRENPELVRSYGEAARKAFLERFTRDKVLPAWLEMLEKTIASTASGR